VSVGLVGLGYWGPNLLRAFDEIPGTELRWLCDLDPRARLAARQRFPEARVTADFDDLLDDDGLDAVVIATPSPTHASLALRSLEADKHVFVEKPLALSGDDADRVVLTARRRGRCLMVGHVLLYHPAVRKLKELIDDGVLGDLFYVYGNRQNLGKIRQDENALWSLGAHDIAVLHYLLADQPIEVSARGESYLQEGVADVVFCFLRFATGITAHLHLSWLDPHKLRKLTVVGSKQMAVFDDMDVERKLTVYDKNATPRSAESFGEYIQVRFGDIQIPRVPSDEPLRLECEQFVSSIRSSSFEQTGASDAAAVVRILAALQRSLDEGGQPETLDDAPLIRGDALRLVRVAAPDAVGLHPGASA
jgi:predicted dehydrogenase